MPLKLGHLLLNYKYGEPANDGLVPLPSAKWRDDVFQGVLPWDHFNQVGWWTPDRFAAGDRVAARFEKSVQQFYLGIARGLEVLQS
jgi:hypothetical protein